MIDLIARRREMMGASGEEADQWIHYYVYAATDGTSRALYSGQLPEISRMIFDGEEITPIAIKTFDTSGTYSVDILLVDTTTIPDNGFNAGHYRDVVLPSCVTSIGNNAFRNYSATNGNLTCLAMTPPSLVGDPFYNRHGLNVYVPSDSLSAYQTAWNQMTNIQAII